MKTPDLLAPPRKKTTARIKRSAKFLCVFAGLLLLTMWLIGGFLIAPAREQVGAIPSGLVGKPVEFRSGSGSLLKGWLLRGKPHHGVVILLHGVRGNRLHMLDRARFLTEAGYAVLLFDFGAHGESEGDHITFGFRESRDVQSAVGFVRQELPGEKIGVIGVSLGGAAALLTDPPLDVDALVLEMVYPTIQNAIEDRFAMRLGWFGKGLAPLLAVQLPLRLHVSVAQLRPIDHIRILTMPKLFIAGSEDRHTPLAEAKQLYEAAGAPKDLWIVEGAAHENLYAKAPTEYRRRVLALFAKSLLYHPQLSQFERHRGTEKCESLSTD